MVLIQVNEATGFHCSSIQHTKTADSGPVSGVFRSDSAHSKRGDSDTRSCQGTLQRRVCQARGCRRGTGEGKGAGLWGEVTAAPHLPSASWPLCFPLPACSSPPFPNQTSSATQLSWELLVSTCPGHWRLLFPFRWKNSPKIHVISSHYLCWLKKMMLLHWKPRLGFSSQRDVLVCRETQTHREPSPGPSHLFSIHGYR